MINGRAILKIDNTKYDILRCGYTFKRDIDAKGRPLAGLQGGDIWVDIESKEDNILLIKMTLPKVPPISGSIEFWGSNDEEELQLLREVKFEKAWIYEQGEAMIGYSFLPIITRVRIAPVRLDIGDRVKLDRRWPETYGFFWEKYKPKEVKIGPSRGVEKNEDTEIAEIEIVTPLTQKEHCSKAGIELGESYKLRVKRYTNGSPRNSSSIKWEYSYLTNKENGEIVVGAVINQRGEEIEFVLDDSAALGNEISFYAYISKQKNEGECTAYVNPLWRYKGTKKWGKLQTGYTRTGHKWSPQQLIENFNLDENAKIRMQEFINGDENHARSRYEGLLHFGTKSALSDDDNVEQRVINNFYYGTEGKMSFGVTSMLSQKLRINPSFQNYWGKYIEIIKQTIKNRSIETVDGNEFESLFREKYGKNEPTKPSFSNWKEIFNYDYYGLMGGTQTMKIDLIITQIDVVTYIVKTRMYIGDWYGADEDDINGATLKGFMPSLSAFFWLQHHYGYHPFETEIIYESVNTIKL